MKLHQKPYRRTKRKAAKGEQEHTIIEIIYPVNNKVNNTSKITMNKDSKDETTAHILRVRELLYIVQNKLEERGFAHDLSKLQSPEKEGFDEVTGALRGLTYGSDEYKAQLERLKPILAHHYAHNSHHPEHYPNGVDGMTLLDLVEMFCDWKAATERHADGSIEKSIQHNKGRFKLTDQLASIFENSRKEMGW